MKIILTDIEKGSKKEIQTPLTLKKWLSIHFGAWGFYHVEKIAKNVYYISDSFDDTLLYQVEL